MAAFVSRYARAFADVVLSAHLDATAIDARFEDFLAAWDQSKELRDAFATPAVTVSQKIGILDKLNATLGMQKELRNLLAVLIQNGRIAQVREVATAYRTELKERQGVRQAEVVTARELSEEERHKLIAGVGELAGSKVEATFKLDAAILGGTLVRVGSTVYDGSLRGRMERLREALIAG